jgi:hypothetical protein
MIEHLHLQSAVVLSPYRILIHASHASDLVSFISLQFRSDADGVFFRHAVRKAACFSAAELL